MDKAIAILVRSVVLVVILGWSLLVFTAYHNDVKEAEYYRENGGQTTATVTKARSYTTVEAYGQGRNRTTVTTDYCDFTIEYTVDGEDYTVNVEDYTDGEFTEGEVITVYYLDSNPVRNLRFNLKPSPTKYIAFGAPAVIIGAVFLITDILRYRRQRKINNT